LNDLIVELKARKIAVLLIHRSNRGTKSEYRGSSNLLATLETVIQLKETTGEYEGARMRVHFQKARNTAPLILNGKILHLPMTGPWTMAERNIKEEQVDEDAEEMARAVKACWYESQGELARVFSINQSTVSRRLKRAISKKMITQEEIDECFKTAESKLVDTGLESLN